MPVWSILYKYAVLVNRLQFVGGVGRVYLIVSSLATRMNSFPRSLISGHSLLYYKYAVLVNRLQFVGGRGVGYI